MLLIMILFPIKNAIWLHLQQYGKHFTRTHCNLSLIRQTLYLNYLLNENYTNDEGFLPNGLRQVIILYGHWDIDGNGFRTT